MDLCAVCDSANASDLSATAALLGLGTSHLIRLSLDFVSDIVEVGEFLVTDLPARGSTVPRWRTQPITSDDHSTCHRFHRAHLVEHGPRLVFGVLLRSEAVQWCMAGVTPGVQLPKPMQPAP